MNKKELEKNIKNIIISILLLSVLVLGSMYFEGNKILKEGNEDLKENSFQTYKELSPEVFNSMMRIKDTNNFFLLKVDSSSEETIKNTDAFIPYLEIIEKKNLLPNNLSTRIVVYSSNGKMSKIAAKKLILLGYLDVFELKGGLNSLKEKGLLEDKLLNK